MTRFAMSSSGSETSTSHINDLPAELLSDIFYICYKDTKSRHKLNSKLPPLLFGQICRHWRYVSFNLTPKIWRSLHVDWERHCPRDGLTLVKDWIDRTQESHLVVNLGDDAERLPPFDVVSDTLIQAISNVKTLSLTLPISQFGIFNSTQFNALTSLVSLSVWFCPSPGGEQPSHHHPEQQFSIHGCRQLRRFKCDIPTRFHNEVFFGAYFSGVPWHQLTHLSLYHVCGVAAAHTILAQCTNLEDCTLSVKDQTFGQVLLGAVSSAILPRLQSLSLSLSGQAHLLLRTLTLPSLIHLMIFSPDTQKSLIPILCALRDRSGFSLSTLNMSNAAAVAQDLIHFVTPFVGLTSLVLFQPSVPASTILRALCNHPGEVPLLPRLQTLDLALKDLEFSDNLLFDMLESRISGNSDDEHGVARLVRATIRRKSHLFPMNASSLKRTSALKDAGMVITISA